MSILGVYCEDVDFPTQASGFAMANTSGGTRYRSDYARGYHTASSSNINRSLGKPLSAAVTDCWVGGYIQRPNIGTSHRYLGIGKQGTSGGIFIGVDSSNSNKVALWLCNSSGTYTNTAQEGGSGSISLGTLAKFDMHIESFNSASGRVRIYKDGSNTALIDYTGDLRWTGATDLDQFIAIYGGACFHSEGILADEDTRALGVRTHAIAAAGDSNTLDAGAYTDIDELALSQADIVSSGTTGQEFQANLDNSPTGSFAPKAVIVSYQGIRGATGITKWKVGVKTGGTVNVGQTDTMSTAWDSYNRVMNTNPVTSGGWTTIELDALQVAFESLT